METPQLRPEYTLRENLPPFPVEINGWKYKYDLYISDFSINFPENVDLAFGAQSTYKRCGNVIVTFKRTQQKGTLYVGDDGEWLLVSKEGLISASGSAGSFPLLPSPIKPVEQYKSKSRFDDIVGFD